MLVLEDNTIQCIPCNYRGTSAGSGTQRVTVQPHLPTRRIRLRLRALRRNPRAPSQWLRVSAQARNSRALPARIALRDTHGVALVALRLACCSLAGLLRCPVVLISLPLFAAIRTLVGVALALMHCYHAFSGMK